MGVSERSSRSQKTKRLVFCAILCALSFVLAMLGTLMGVLDLTGVIFSGLFVALVMIEIGVNYAFMLWLVTSALLLLFLPDKLVAMEYVVCGGCYPILKNYLERIPLKPLQWVLKFVYFNAILTGLILLATKVQLFMSADNELNLEWLVYLIGNVFFIVYDLCMSVYIRYYLVILRQRLKVYKFLR